MLVKEIVDILNAKEIYVARDDIYEKNYNKGFSSDLMSDALMLLKDEVEDVLFITGLVNVQSLRTAEVLDLETIIFVRGKAFDESIIDTAKSLHINLFQTTDTMFETCGKLYEKGMRR